MRSSLSVLLLVAVLFGAGYWYYEVEAVCDAPVAYRIGFIDDKFDITTEEVRAAVSNAESMWEDATGRNLFTYDEGAKMSINFIYDERQQEADSEKGLREDLEERSDISNKIKRQYEDLVDEYDDLDAIYIKKSSDYERALQVHNSEVERWNEQGGAPESVYKKLNEDKEDLAEKQEKLNELAGELNKLVKQINKIGDQGNLLVNNYNNVVDVYNDSFNEDKEFTQGDYQGDSINIYQYDSNDELIIVLAHEFGHALSIDHVEGKDSVMYHLMEEQDVTGGITDYDKEAFITTCGDNEFTLWSIF